MNYEISMVLLVFSILGILFNTYGLAISKHLKLRIFLYFVFLGILIFIILKNL